jgi:hypothetical protein
VRAVSASGSAQQPPESRSQLGLMGARVACPISSMWDTVRAAIRSANSRAEVGLSAVPVASQACPSRVISRPNMASTSRSIVG